jgi:hypothetical protein
MPDWLKSIFARRHMEVRPVSDFSDNELRGIYETCLNSQTALTALLHVPAEDQDDFNALWDAYHREMDYQLELEVEMNQRGLFGA